jgi:3-oxoacyl-[acyl-carrier-protein] synthase II
MSRIREVVITGAGVVSPIGVGADAFWRALMAGRSGVKPVSVLPAAHLPVTFAGEVTDFDGKQFITPRKSLKVMSREIQFAVAAAAMAMRHAEFTSGAVDPERFGVVFGAEMMHSPTDELASAYRASVIEDRFDFRRWGDASMREIFPLWMLKYLPNMPACHIGIAHDARGPNNTITLGDASSLAALVEAVRVIERGHADAMITGGVGSWLSATAFTRTQKLDVSHHNEAPEEACRPFDADRDGRVFGEGGAAFVLESAESARQRGARVLAVVRGAASSFERLAKDQSCPAAAVRRAMRAALSAADWKPEDIGHVKAHGASTISGDRAEAAAIVDLLGDTPVTAPSSYFGSLGPGGGAVELLATVLGFAHDVVTPTRNFQHADQACPVNVVHDEPLHGARQTALALNYTGYGQAIAVALAGPDE